MKAATPLTFVGGSGVSLVHAVQGTLDHVDWVVFGVRVLLIVNVRKNTSLDAIAGSGTGSRIIAFQSFVSQIPSALSCSL